jgi:hypothetical protein
LSLASHLRSQSASVERHKRDGDARDTLCRAVWGRNGRFKSTRHKIAIWGERAHYSHTGLYIAKPTCLKGVVKSLVS